MRPLERLSRSSFALMAALLPWASFLPGLRAQEDGALEPAKELEKLERLLGDWKGSGIARMSAGGPDLPWTGAGSVQRILDGFAIQEDLRVDPGPGVPPLLFRTVYGWDPHREQYRWFGISNMGFGGVGDAHLTSDGKLLVTREHMEDGVPVVDTTTTWIEEGKYRFRILRSRAGAPFFAHVEATFEKSGDSIDVAKVKDAEVLPPPAE
ncbi:MAG TPA: DUF1579 family protein, partial [Planctomycetota bacterium]|nr:DUF1579 family protein [Planctomycetota bacterium]